MTLLNIGYILSNDKITSSVFSKCEGGFFPRVTLHYDSFPSIIDSQFGLFLGLARRSEEHILIRSFLPAFIQVKTIVSCIPLCVMLFGLLAL